MSNSAKYILSFTAASLRLNEMVKVAKAVNENGTLDLNTVKESGIVFNSGKTKTSDRQFREIKQRLERLTHDQINILIQGDLISQKQIAFLAVCKRYRFIRDFVVDTIRDKVLVFDYKINVSDFKSFINAKVQLHPELEEFSESTLKKAEQVMFHILEQVGIINNAVERIIQPQMLQQEVIDSIVNDDQIWLKIFLMSDRDIKPLTN
jgi:hypothetical protein